MTRRGRQTPDEPDRTGLFDGFFGYDDAEPDGRDADAENADSAEDADDRRPARRRSRGAYALRRIAVTLLILMTGVGGAVLGVVLGGHQQHTVGPIKAEFTVRPALHGDSVVEIPPLGALSADTHDGPAQLDIRADGLDQAAATWLFQHPQQLTAVAGQTIDEVRSAVEDVVIQSALCAVAGALVVGFVVFRSPRRALLSGGVAVALLVGTGGAAAATWNPQSLREPSYSGLLTNAPAVIGSVQNLEQNFNAYQQQLVGMVDNVSRLYATASSLPTYQPGNGTIRILHVSDLHLNPAGFDIMRSVIKQYKIQAVIDTGDLTDRGSAAEGTFVDEIGTLHLPYVWIKGNHDSATTVNEVKSQPNAIVLDDSETKVAGIAVGGAGDPLFTPDRTIGSETSDDNAREHAAGEELATVAQHFATPPDVLLVHEPRMAVPLDGVAPLVLAGHLHRRLDYPLPHGTQVLVEGSTGGAGLRGLDNEKPTPLECSVLYFNAKTHRLQAYDSITLGGLGESKVSIDRTLVSQQEQNDAGAAGASSQPSSGAASGASSAQPR